MAQAIFKGTLIAQSDQVEEVEGNLYFPPDSIKPEFFRKSTHHTHCGWKGEASYYDISAAGETVPNAAWFYAEPLPKAQNIRGHVAFYRSKDLIVSR